MRRGHDRYLPVHGTARGSRVAVREDLRVYGKVFRSLWDGTLAESWEGWTVFVFMIANADRDGTLEMTREAMCRRSNLPREILDRGLDLLERPDPYSRTADEDGRRIVRLDSERAWGWRIVNYEKYRGLRDERERREQTREAVARYKQKAKVSQGKPRPEQVSRGKPRSAQAEAEAEAEEEALPAASLAIARSLAPAASDRQPENGNPAVAAQTSALVAGLASAMAEKPRHVDPVADAVWQAHPELRGSEGGKQILRTALALAGRLRKGGVKSQVVLTGLAEHYLAHRDRIREPFAYYGPGKPGWEQIVMGVASAYEIERHRAEEQATQAWLAGAR